MNRNNLESANPESAAGEPSAGLGPKKIRTKIFLEVTGLLVIISAFCSVYFPGRVERDLSLDIGRTVDEVSAVSSLGLVPSLATNDRVSLEQMIKVQSERIGRALYMVLEDGSGQVLASVNRDVAEQ